MTVDNYERIFVTDADCITVYENNLVTLTLADGRVMEHLEPRRLFPVSRTDQYISLIDATGTEVAVIRRMTDLNEESRRVIQNSVDDYYFVPQILRIVHANERYGFLHWTVQTDRGIKEFDIANRDHDIKVYPDGRVRVRDADDNRYIIDDYHVLDTRSKLYLMSNL